MAKNTIILEGLTKGGVSLGLVIDDAMFSYLLKKEELVEVEELYGRRIAKALPDRVRVVETSKSVHKLSDLATTKMKIVDLTDEAQSNNNVDKAVEKALGKLLENYNLVPKTETPEKEEELTKLKEEAASLGIEIKATWGIKKLTEVIGEAKAKI